jgi:hypothetical protein
MNGAHTAFTGRIGRMLRYARPVTANPGHPSPWRWTPRPTAMPGDVGAGGVVRRCAVGTLAPRHTKGAEVYCEGRVTFGTWAGRGVKPGRGSTSRCGRSSRWGRSGGGGSVTVQSRDDASSHAMNRIRCRSTIRGGRFVPGVGGNPAGKSPGARVRAIRLAEKLTAGGEATPRVIERGRPPKSEQARRDGKRRSRRARACLLQR